jgi:hypothetical protein
MPRVLCSLPNASTNINGVDFVPQEDGRLLSAEISQEEADGFTSIQGYDLFVLDPDEDARKKAEEAEAAQRAADDAAKAAAASKAAAKAAKAPAPKKTAPVPPPAAPAAPAAADQSSASAADHAEGSSDQEKVDGSAGGDSGAPADGDEGAVF